ncbi:hypothetical protein MKW98_027332 [Papaver atlanticum]|uniref:Uncharacterized protein n=1 Tax=Papaver atlanticum TaxID=357466 RepID=A0AAD4XJ32_9MAGN|nr:hypothetical protein MKW98_027332 [Papaver atlanticum]
MIESRGFIQLPTSGAVVSSQRFPTFHQQIEIEEDAASGSSISRASSMDYTDDDDNEEVSSIMETEDDDEDYPYDSAHCLAKMAKRDALKANHLLRRNSKVIKPADFPPKLGKTLWNDAFGCATQYSHSLKSLMVPLRYELREQSVIYLVYIL